MNNLLKEALYNYEINQSEVDFIRHSENETYKIKDMVLNKQYVLRIYNPSEEFSLDIFNGFKSPRDYTWEEMNILNSIRRYTKINVQMPIRNKNGDFVTILNDGIPVTLLSWISGTTLEKVELSDSILFKLGIMVGKFHKFSKEWSVTQNLNRYSYDKVLLKKIAFKLIGGLELKVITSEQFHIIDQAIKGICNAIDKLDIQKESKGLVHSDLAGSNIILSDDGEIIPIDFGLSGISYYYMDLGSLFSHFSKSEQQNCILKGYKSIIKEEIEIKYIETFMVFQIILFIATHIERAHKFQWFSSAVDRWSKEFFVPFISDIRFLNNI